MVIHRGWRRGLLSSILAGLRRVPRGAPFLLYPVNHPRLTPAVIQRLVEAFAKRRAGQSIILPRFRGKAGHPVIFTAELRNELQNAETARHVVYRDSWRVKFVAVRTAAVL